MNNIEIADLSFSSFNDSDHDQICNPPANVISLGGSTVVWSGELEEEPRADEEEPAQDQEPMETEEAEEAEDEPMELEMEQNYVGAGLSNNRNVERQCAQGTPPPSPVAGEQ